MDILYNIGSFISFLGIIFLLVLLMDFWQVYNSRG